ncbi:MAG TPA: hypothetical protein VHP33_04905 [Polyangiaceae bacterium]|nr:hypothetical protein [Polyangiaceae bacterium]
MAIKTFTVSALTSGVLVLAYAAWSKWRGAPKLASAPQLTLEPQPALEPTLLAEPELFGQRSATEGEAIDVVLDDLWGSDETAPNPDEQLVDFSAELAYDDEEGAVAPEGLGVRWLTRATEAMSPFHHALSVRDEAEAALLDGVTPSVEEPGNTAPESSKRFKDGDFDVDLPASKRGG